MNFCLDDFISFFFFLFLSRFVKVGIPLHDRKNVNTSFFFLLLFYFFPFPKFYVNTSFFLFSFFFFHFQSFNMTTVARSVGGGKHCSGDVVSPQIDTDS